MSDSEQLRRIHTVVVGAYVAINRAGGHALVHLGELLGRLAEAEEGAA